VFGEAKLEGGAGRPVVGLEAKALSAGFFLPQLSQSLLGILNPLLVEQPGNVTTDIEKTAVKTSVVRQRLFRMANASFQKAHKRK
jgi:hypothetical protein